MRKIIDIDPAIVKDLKIMAVKVDKDLKNYIQDLLIRHVRKGRNGKYNYSHNPDRRQRSHGNASLLNSAYKISYFAARYYKEATGEALTKQEAINRWRMLRHPDKKIIQEVIKDIGREQKTLYSEISGK